jgi:ferredoxin
MPPLDEDPGPARVRVRFEPDGANPRDVRVPAGVSVFDAASWNGIAIDSTCGGHGTCRKCKIRVLDGAVPVSRLDPRAFDPEQLTAAGGASPSERRGRSPAALRRRHRSTHRS